MLPDPFSPETIALLAVLVLFANSVEAVIGFGGTLLVIAPAAHLLPIAALVPVLLPLNLVLSMVIVWRHYAGINARALWRQVFPAAMLGMPIGFMGLNHLPVGDLKRLLGAMVVTIAAMELARFRRRAAGGPRRPLGNWAALAWLFGGGVAQGMFLAGGPMVVYFANRNLEGKAQFRVTLSALWMLLNYVLLMTHIGTGSINPDTVRVSGILLAPLLLGIGLGERLHDRVNEGTFRLAVLVLLLLAGTSILVGA